MYVRIYVYVTFFIEYGNFETFESSKPFPCRPYLKEFQKLNCDSSDILV